MHRKYVSIRKCKQHDPEVIKNALIEVQNGGSFKKVAEKYEIEHTVLYRHMKRGQTEKRVGQTALSEYSMMKNSWLADFKSAVTGDIQLTRLL